MLEAFERIVVGESYLVGNAADGYVAAVGVDNQVGVGCAGERCRVGNLELGSLVFVEVDFAFYERRFNAVGSIDAGDNESVGAVVFERNHF